MTAQKTAAKETTVIGTLTVSTAQTNTGKSDRALRVTFLADEWGSSKRGLSTINRQLPVEFSKHMQLVVTLLVPQLIKQATNEIDKFKVFSTVLKSQLIKLSFVRLILLCQI